MTVAATSFRLIVLEFSGLGTGPTTDKVTASNGTSKTVSTGATGVLTSATDLVIATGFYTSQTSPAISAIGNPINSYTGKPTGNGVYVNTGGQGKAHSGAYLIPGATTTTLTSWTITDTGTSYRYATSIVALTPGSGTIADTLNAGSTTFIVTGKAGTPLVAANAGSTTVITGKAGTPLVAATLSLGTNAYAITGDAASFKSAFKPSLGAYAVTGDAGTVQIASKLSLSPATYVITGDSIVAHPGFIFSISPSTYVLTGSAGGFEQTAKGDSGAYSITGNIIKLAQKTALTAGSYSVTGDAGKPLIALIETHASGLYSISGSAAKTLAAMLISASPAAYSIAGKLITVLQETGVDPGTYVVSGDAAKFAIGGGIQITFDAAAGSYSISGDDATLLMELVWIATNGAFSLMGNNAALGTFHYVSPFDFFGGGAPPEKKYRKRMLTEKEKDMKRKYDRLVWEAQHPEARPKDRHGKWTGPWNYRMPKSVAIGE